MRFPGRLLCTIAACFALWTEAQCLLAAEPAKSDKAWAYRAPAPTAVPAVKSTAWVHNPIDAFILAKLEKAALKPAAPADRAVLLRRLSFDLIGLPPTPEQIEDFVNDPSADATGKVVDRLLASPRYGEHWALYWLDLVRYAETDGFKADDVRPAAWRYRDYVIRSLNQDKPYDRFVREQLAGDELYADDGDALVATGFNRHFPDEYNAVNLEQRRQEILNDMTDTTGQVFLGLTLGCARCHDHKFDPILQTDYYRIQAFFAPYKPAEVPVGNSQELDHYREQLRAWEGQTAELRQKISEMEEPYRKQFLAKRKVRFPKEYQDAWDLPAEKRTPLQQQLAAMVDKQLQPAKDEVTKSMKPDVRQQWQELAKQMGDFSRLKPPLPPNAMGMTDIGPIAPATYLLKRGDWRKHSQEIEPGFLSAIEDKTADLPTFSQGNKTTGRRTVLAQWLTRPDNPLTARVQVNRIWQHHFGRGIVGTPSDFGKQGEPPMHPELLDWLAREFVARGWSLKAIHKLMVMSSTYQQSTEWNQANAAVDPQNQLLWRMNRRRLEGETLRDGMLSVSGSLSSKQGGPSTYPELPAELGVPRGGWPVSADPAERNRRSVYIFVKRNLRYPLFSVFDAPDSNETCARRHISTNAPQALTLLNSKIVQQYAEAFASRVLRDAGREPTNVVDRVYRLALGRLPDAAERKTTLAFLDEDVKLLRQKHDENELPATSAAQAAHGKSTFDAAVIDLCHAMMNLNEFLYVD